MNDKSLIPVERIEASIYRIRGESVMLDRIWQNFIRVSTSVFNQAVKRHRHRFPADFMFQLTKDEAEEWWLAVNANRLRSQSVILKRGQHLKYNPHAFTEHGILMLSSVLNSERAIEVNIEIMRAFVRLRQMLLSDAELSRRLDEVERKYDRQFKVVFDAIRKLMSPPPRNRKEIGFRSHSKKK